MFNVFDDPRIIRTQCAFHGVFDVDDVGAALDGLLCFSFVYGANEELQLGITNMRRFAAFKVFVAVCVFVAVLGFAFEVGFLA